MRRVVLVFVLVVAGCEVTDAREALVVSTIARADELLIRSRPELAAGKYERMASDPYAFYRGTVPLFRRDVEDPSLSIGVTTHHARGPLPLALGDAHPENFGTLRAADGTFAIEPNDFDGADRYPYHWDLRRLTVGMAVAAQLANAGDDDARAVTSAAAPDIVAATARAYAEAAIALAGGAHRARMTDDGAFEMPALFVDLLRRSRGDETSRDELDERTEVQDGARRLRRGMIDPDDPESQQIELAPVARDALEEMLARYRESLIDPPPPEHFTILDAVRELGSGIASWPRVRIIVLVRGPTDAVEDDLLLEIKEIDDSTASGWFPPGVYADDVVDRVILSSRAAWARPDAEPLWGGSTLLGFPVQVRLEAEMHKTIRVERMVGAAGTPADLIAIGQRLAYLLARVHAARVPGAEMSIDAIASAIEGDVDGFVDDERARALEYAALVMEDWARFCAAHARLGPRLGIPFDERDRASSDLRALFGAPLGE